MLQNKSLIKYSCTGNHQDQMNSTTSSFNQHGWRVDEGPETFDPVSYSNVTKYKTDLKEKQDFLELQQQKLKKYEHYNL